MAGQLPFDILPQPDVTTCGPTCLHAVYNYYGDEVDLTRLISEVQALYEGGTFAVFLASHALRRGYGATIYTYNLQLFDPTWFLQKGVDLRAKLEAQASVKVDPRLREATTGYLEYLDLGGVVKFEDLTSGLIRKYLARGRPILTGLSATYLHHSIREYGLDNEDDDLRGSPVGHFVVLCGYSRERREVLVADPLYPNPMSENHVYAVPTHRVLAAIPLGILTYDANLLILEPPEDKKRA